MKKKPDYGFPLSEEILKTMGVVIAQTMSPPVDHVRAQEEFLLDKKFGYDTFGAKIPAKFFA